MTIPPAGRSPGRPTVSVLIPVLNEAQHLAETLRSVSAQAYDRVVEVLVIDGGSRDETREVAAAAGATVLENRMRIQAAGLNVGLTSAAGDVVVRVDGHCTLEPDYVERCVEVLQRTGAAMVGGAMVPRCVGPLQTAIGEAMMSAVGAGPARFHVGGLPGWVDTVYLGAYRTDLARAVGGYRTDVGVNEDAEFAHRMRPHGGVYLDPSIRSHYTPRSDLPAVARQFWRYGLSRAATVRRHRRSLSARQLAAPALLFGLASPYRREVALAYLAMAGLHSVSVSRRAGWRAGAASVAVLPAMHLPWGAGFLLGVGGVVPPPSPAPLVELTGS